MRFGSFSPRKVSSRTASPRTASLAAAGLGILLLVGCDGAPEDAANIEAANNVATTNAAAGSSDAQDQVRSLPEGQRNAVLIRAIRDADQNCQGVEASELTQTSNNLPVYMATCDDGAVYAVAIRDDGTATVQPVMPAEGRE